MAQLAHELVDDAAARAPAALALRHGAESISYAALAAAAANVAAALRACGAGAGEHIALRLPGCPAFVMALLGASAAGCAVVPVDPGLDAARCAALLHDCGAGVLIAAAADLDSLHPALAACPMLRTVVVHGGPAPAGMAQRTIGWESLLAIPQRAARAPAAAALAALLYRIDASGEPVGMALSHRNLVAGAQSTARCAGLGPDDRVLAALPLHSDHGLNALLATFAAGATAVLDACAGGEALVHGLAKHEAGDGISGLFASAASLQGPESRAFAHVAAGLRFLVCAGGGPGRAALDILRGALPRTRIHLLYDIGDACRSTSLMPSILDERTGTIARALPPTPGLARRETGHFPGVAARKDADGFLYLADTDSETIVTQGYRVSPRDVEKIVVGTGLVAEAAAVGVAHPVLGQVIAVLATPRPGARLDSSILFGACQARLPRYMLPAMVDVRRVPLPRARDGRIDRALLAGELAPLFAEVTP